MRFVVRSGGVVIAALVLGACDAFASPGDSCGTSGGGPFVDKCDFPTTPSGPGAFGGGGPGAFGFAGRGGSPAGASGFGPAGTGGVAGVGGAGGTSGMAGAGCDPSPEAPSGLPPCGDVIDEDAGVDDDAGAD